METSDIVSTDNLKDFELNFISIQFILVLIEIQIIQGLLWISQRPEISIRIKIKVNFSNADL